MRDVHFLRLFLDGGDRARVLLTLFGGEWAPLGVDPSPAGDILAARNSIWPPRSRSPAMRIAGNVAPDQSGHDGLRAHKRANRASLGRTSPHSSLPVT